MKTTLSIAVTLTMACIAILACTDATRPDVAGPSFGEAKGTVKVSICHIMGKPITVGEPAVVAAHLAHGDTEGPVAPPSGLVSWWPGDGNANDIIGGQVTTLKNGAGFASGKVGQAFSLDGVDDYVSIINTINLPGDYSVTGWFKTTAPALAQAIFAATRPEGHGIFVLLRADGRLRFLHRFPLGGSGGTNIVSLPTTTKYDDGVFHYFVAAKAGATMSLHVDGVPVGTESDASVFPTTLNQIVLGQLSEAASIGNWVGLLDEVSVYNRALSLAEIQAIFNAGNAGSDGKCKP